MRLRKRLKSLVARIANVMPNEFKDDDIVSTFKIVYPGMWNEMKSSYKSSLLEYKNRIRKGKKAVYPQSPKTLILSVGKSAINKARIANERTTPEKEETKTGVLDRMIRKGKRKAEEIKKREDTCARQIQKACPDYIGNLIRHYFFTRKKKGLDIDSRYVLIMECAKFKSTATITFLQKINACEKNNELRLLAYKCLKHFGVYPRLTRNRKGKKKASAVAMHTIDPNPSELLKLIYENQQFLYKSFDVFLSHSYGRQDELLEAKNILNRQGLVVYVDWINDAEMLERSKQNEDTFKVLYERLKQSSSLLFIQTEASVGSPYCMEELQFFKQLGRPMYIIEVDEVENAPDILKELVRVKLESGLFKIAENGHPLSRALLKGAKAISLHS